ncbi:MAG: helix-turn-helix transcriptional regulator [Alphaproteobacteria bacterium]|nr:helix-turn-helix transcriptional regulator [Alphaproteobacteria bacterium]
MQLPDLALAETTLNMLKDRWKVRIIECLLSGTMRFGELKKELGDITQKVLTSNLRMLEQNGIIIRHVYAQIPPRVDYTLTTLGYNLKPVLDSMVAWAEIYQATLLKELNTTLETGCQTFETLNNKLETSYQKLENKLKEIKKNF